ncbi:MAG: MFS transporter [Erysipelotrichaceae bacterium]|nr:MFS transporter [Erysipelotrichaceae bacterium]
MKNSKKFILFVYGILGLAANLAHPITPTLFNIRGFESTLFGLAFSMMSLFNFLFSFFWAKKLNKIKINLIFIVCCMGYAFGQFLFLIGNNVYVMLLSRAISGMFIAGVFIGMPYYFALISDENEKSSYITKLSTFFTVGGTVGYFFGGFLGGINIYLPVALQSLIYFVAAFILFFIVDVKVNNDKLVTKKLFDLGIKLNRIQISVMLLTFCLFVSSTSLTQMFAYYLINVLNVTPTINGLIKGIVGILSIAINFSFTLKIQNSKNIFKWIKFYILILFIMYLLFINVSNINMLFIVLGILIMVIDTIHLPILQSTCIKNTIKEEQSIALGLQNSVRSIAMIFGAILSSYLFAFNNIFPFLISTIFVGLGLFVVVNIKRN